MSYRKEMEELILELRTEAADSLESEDYREKKQRQAEVLDFILNHLVVPPQSQELDD